MRRSIGTTTLALCMLLAAPVALADPPAHAGGGKGKGGPPAHAGGPSKAGKSIGHKGDTGRPHVETRSGGSRDDHRGSGAEVTVRFHDSDYAVVRDYYDDHTHCPPGLAKKNNGCLPPGQAKKWRRGHTLPPEVVYYDVPPELVVRLSPLSAGYRYVRVGADILKIAAGTGLIVDAIEDLGRI